MKDKHFGNFVCNWPSFVKHLILLHSYTFREYSFSLNVEIRFVRARQGGKSKFQVLMKSYENRRINIGIGV